MSSGQVKGGITVEDEEIIRLYWNRSEDAVTATSEKYGAYCTAIALRIVGLLQDAEECVSDTWMRAWNAIPPERPSRLRLWLGRITRNLSVDRLKGLRAQKRGGGQGELLLSELEQCIPAASHVESEADDAELARLLNDFLRAQRPEHRAAFILRYYYAEPVADVAKKLSMNENTAATVLFRMRKALRSYLEREGVSV